MMKIIRILVFLLILNSFILTGFFVSEYTGQAVKETSKLEYATLIKAIDGDTIDVLSNNITQRVRMLGLNTPEKKQRGYEEAKAFLQEFENKTIKLEMIKEDKDKYGRMLRYAFFDSIFINKEILERGLAHFYTYNEDRYTEELKKAEEKAREKEIGIWGKSGDECGNCIILVNLNEVDPGEYVILKNVCGFDCNLNKWTINDDSSSHERKISLIINSGEEYKFDYNGSVWNDDGDSFYLRDEEGLLVLFYRY